MSKQSSVILGDDLLVARAQGGDLEAWEVLYARYSRLVWGIVFRVVWRDADDASQEIWIKIVRHLDRFDPTRSSFPTWISSIAFHGAMDWYRRSKRDREILDSDLTQDCMQVTFLDQMPNAASVLQSLPDALFEGYSSATADCLSLLKDNVRIVLLLREVEDIQGGEIAREFGKSDAWVSGQLKIGRRLLRQCLETKGINTFVKRGTDEPVEEAGYRAVEEGSYGAN